MPPAARSGVWGRRETAPAPAAPRPASVPGMRDSPAPTPPAPDKRKAAGARCRRGLTFIHAAFPSLFEYKLINRFKCYSSLGNLGSRRQGSLRPGQSGRRLGPAGALGKQPPAGRAAAKGHWRDSPRASFMPPSSRLTTGTGHNASGLPYGSVRGRFLGRKKSFSFKFPHLYQPLF